MVKKLIWNDIKQNKLLACATIFFMGISAMIFALTALLFFHLMGAIDGLMDRAKVPDYMQCIRKAALLWKIKGFLWKAAVLSRNRKSDVSAKCMGKLANGRFVVF